MLTAGRRVRIESPAVRRSGKILGTIERVDSTGVLIREAGAEPLLAVPYATMRRFEVSGGALSVGARRRNGVRGGLAVGLAAATAILTYTHFTEEEEYVLGVPAGVAGAWVGYVIGSRGKELWRSLTLPEMPAPQEAADRPRRIPGEE